MLYVQCFFRKFHLDLEDRKTVHPSNKSCIRIELNNINYIIISIFSEHETEFKVKLTRQSSFSSARNSNQ